jgi:hypothetical protein
MRQGFRHHFWDAANHRVASDSQKAVAAVFYHQSADVLDEV